MDSPSAYTAALRMLARRELSTAQIRERLARHGFTPESVEDAVLRLTSNGTLDDRRVARAVARTRAQVKRQGRRRVARELAVIGIPDEVARHALDEVFGEVDEAALVDEALARRLRGRISVEDPAVRRRILGALLRQGFGAEAIRDAMRRARRKSPL